VLFPGNHGTAGIGPQQLGHTAGDGIEKLTAQCAGYGFGDLPDGIFDLPLQADIIEKRNNQ